MDKDFYNSSSAAKLGWDPSWFGCDEFNDELVNAIKKWQRKKNLQVQQPMSLKKTKLMQKSTKK